MESEVTGLVMFLCLMNLSQLLLILMTSGPKNYSMEWNVE
jgi:hypothetical protein